MKINNQIDTTSGGGQYFSSKELKNADDKGVKVRLYGDAFMGYYYFQKTDDGKITVVRMETEGKMEKPTDGFQGAKQKLGKALYTIGWNYKEEKAVLVTLDKVALINAVLDIANDDDLADVSDYDLKMSYHEKETPQAKYKVARLDKSAISKEIKAELDEFAKTINLEEYMKGGDAFVTDSVEDEDTLEETAF